MGTTYHTQPGLLSSCGEWGNAQMGVDKRSYGDAGLHKHGLITGMLFVSLHRTLFRVGQFAET